MNLVEDEYRRLRLKEAESKFLGPIGLTHKQLLKNGRKTLGKRTFREKLDDV
jgi:hypothetical protein